jgi:hypothetical protein
MNDDSLTWRWLVGTLAVYLRAHPFACDTAEGIRNWWLETEVTMDDLMAALAWMQQHDVIEQRVAADGHVRYRRLASVEQLDALIARITQG